MLENEGNTINLSENVNQVQPPVFNPIDMGAMGNIGATSGYSQVMQSPVIPVQQVPVSNVTTASTSSETTVIDMQNAEIKAGTIVSPMEQPANVEKPKSEEPIVVEGNVTIPASKLKYLIGQVSKVKTNIQEQPKTCVLNLMANERGLTLRVTSGREDLEIVDRTYSYKNPLELAVDVSLFSEFINSLSDENLILTVDNSTQVLCVNTGIGEFKFPQKNDATGTNLIMNELTFDVPFSSLVKFDYNGLLNIFRNNKGVRVSASKKDYSSIQGTYFAEIACASDGVVMSLIENIEELKNEEFFVSTPLCDLMSTLAFNPDNVRIGFVRRPDSNVIIGIVMSDGLITLCGGIFENEMFRDKPLAACRKYWSTEFGKKVVIDTKEMLKLLKPIIPFIKRDASFTSGSDVLAITIDGSSMKLISPRGEAQNIVHIVNESNYVMQSPIYVRASTLYGIIQTITEDRFDISIDPSPEATGLCISSGNAKCIVAYEEGV